MSDNINFARNLDNNYPTTSITYTKLFNIKEIRYMPYDTNKYNECINIIYGYALLSATRDLSKTENIELDLMIKLFQSGKLTRRKKIVYFNDGSKEYIYGNVNKNNANFSNKYKKLHWGQRKLLISEIDFLNKVNKYTKSDEMNYNIIYPGAAQGYKLIFQMELFPNIKLYLWDPAKFDIILFIADFLRRNIPVCDFKQLGLNYSKKQLELGKKYKGRVFINPELDNIIYYDYFKNSMHNISNNYNNNSGFFTDDSIKYCNNLNLEYNTTNLFISDIRIFTNTKAIDCIKYNYIKNYNNTKEFLSAYDIVINRNYKRDMDLQKEWFMKLNCDYGLLKLKLPKFNNNIVNNSYAYLNGDIILQTWSQICSSECRLFIRKDVLNNNSNGNKSSKNTKIYDINLYNAQMRYYNNIMRLSNFKDILLTDILPDWLTVSYLNNTYINTRHYKSLTMTDIWKYFIPLDKIGIDSVIETQILYEYLKNKKPFVSLYDIILIISDITQTLLNRTDLSYIMSYFNNFDTLKESDNFNKIINDRSFYHSKFNKRLDYNSSIYDNNFCEVK